MIPNKDTMVPNAAPGGGGGGGMTIGDPVSGGTPGDYLFVGSGPVLAQAAPGALTGINDANVTLTIGGTPIGALFNAVSLTLGWIGQLGLNRGGTNADLSATGGAGQYLKQSSVGAAVTVGTIPASDIGSGAALSRVNDTNVTLTLGGSPLTALLVAASLTLGWTGQLAETRGGTNQSTYTLGDILYSSASNTPRVTKPSRQPSTTPLSHTNVHPSGLTGSAMTSPALPRV